jgi:hypothetical protein
MSKDKAGNPVFIKGKEYRPKAHQNPVWPKGQTSVCLDSEDWVYGAEDGSTIVVKNGKGLFTNGDDTRWWVANDNFEEV